MNEARGSAPRTGIERAAGRMVVAGKLHLAAALISNATFAMNAENQVRLHHGMEPPYNYGSFWAEIESIYDQLALPHAGGVILPEDLFDTPSDS